MLILTDTSDVVRLVTDSTATLDVYAAFVDLDGTTVTPGALATAIGSATTTTVVASPSGTAKRNVKELHIRNKHATTSVTVTVEFYTGTTAYQLESVVLGPGGKLSYVEGVGFDVSTSVTSSAPWHGVLAGAYGNGNPATLMHAVQRAGNIAATPTNIGTTVARCSAFMLSTAMTVNRIRAFGVGATTNVFRVALYRYSDLARLTAELPFTTAVDTWVSIGSALGVVLSANTLYFVACSVNATGTVAGPACMGGTIAATTGRVNTAPNSLPGSLALTSGAMQGYQFQFAVTAGALPNPAAALVAQAAWTGGMPALWLDSADT